MITDKEMLKRLALCMRFDVCPTNAKVSGLYCEGFFIGLERAREHYDYFAKPAYELGIKAEQARILLKIRTFCSCCEIPTFDKAACKKCPLPKIEKMTKQKKAK